MGHTALLLTIHRSKSEQKRPRKTKKKMNIHQTNSNGNTNPGTFKRVLSISIASNNTIPADINPDTNLNQTVTEVSAVESPKFDFPAFFARQKANAAQFVTTQKENAAKIATKTKAKATEIMAEHPEASEFVNKHKNKAVPAGLG